MRNEPQSPPGSTPASAAIPAPSRTIDGQSRPPTSSAEHPQHSRSTPTNVEDIDHSGFARSDHPSSGVADRVPINDAPFDERQDTPEPHAIHQISSRDMLSREVPSGRPRVLARIPSISTSGLPIGDLINAPGTDRPHFQAEGLRTGAAHGNEEPFHGSAAENQLESIVHNVSRPRASQDAISRADSTATTEQASWVFPSSGGARLPSMREIEKRELPEAGPSLNRREQKYEEAPFSTPRLSSLSDDAIQSLRLHPSFNSMRQPAAHQNTSRLSIIQLPPLPDKSPSRRDAVFSQFIRRASHQTIPLPRLNIQHRAVEEFESRYASALVTNIPTTATVVSPSRSSPQCVVIPRTVSDKATKPAKARHLQRDTGRDLRETGRESTSQLNHARMVYEMSKVAQAHEIIQQGRDEEVMLWGGANPEDTVYRAQGASNTERTGGAHISGEIERRIPQFPDIAARVESAASLAPHALRRADDKYHRDMPPVRDYGGTVPSDTFQGEPRVRRGSHVCDVCGYTATQSSDLKVSLRYSTLRRSN
jgi:hypothetical protein